MSALHSQAGGFREWTSTNCCSNPSLPKRARTQQGRRGYFLVIDGKQRLLALQKFAAPEDAGIKALTLNRLAVRKDLNEKTFAGLQEDPNFTDDLAGRTELAERRLSVPRLPPSQHRERPAFASRTPTSTPSWELRHLCPRVLGDEHRTPIGTQLGRPRLSNARCRNADPLLRSLPIPP
jgi:hypothetical protein